MTSETAAGIARQVRCGARTALDVIEEALDAALRLDPILHFIDELDAAGAREAARRLDETGQVGRFPSAEQDGSGAGVGSSEPDSGGVLAGVPFLVKARTPVESPIIARLVAAGAIPIGTSTRARPGAVSQTFGWNGRDYTRNPWDLSLSPGGSTAGGAAAVAAGVVPIATGGDSGGSLRIPAAFCGIVGFKGTVGRVPRPGGRTLGGLTTAGVIGADLDDVILATSLASGPHRLDPTALPHWPVPTDHPQQLPAQPSTVAADQPRTADGCEPRAADAADADLPRLAERSWRVAYRSSLGVPVADPGVDRLIRERLAECDVSVVEAPLELLPPDDAWLVLSALDAGRGVNAAAAVRARDIRNYNTTALADLFADVDALITPTTLTVAHGYDQHEPNIVVGDLCWGFNVTGHPAVSVPAGLLDGLPVGLQVVAAHGRDDIALAVARSLQAELPLPPVHAER